MPIPLIAGALLSAAPEVVRGITALVQNQRANKASRGLERPTMRVPESINDYVNLSKSMSMIGLPGKDGIEGDIERGSANALQLGKEYGGNTDVAALYANEQGQKRELGVQDAGARLQNIAAYQNALLGKGKFQQNNFQYNEADKYASEAAAISAQKNAATTNGFEAIKNLAGIGVKMMDPALSNKTAAMGGISVPQDPQPQVNTTTTVDPTGISVPQVPQPQVNATTTVDPMVIQFKALLLSNPKAAREMAAKLGIDVSGI